MVNKKNKFSQQIRFAVSLGSVAQGDTGSADRSGAYDVKITDASLWSTYYTNLCKEFKINAIFIAFIPANPMSTDMGYIGLAQAVEGDTNLSGFSLNSFIESSISSSSPRVFTHGSKRKGFNLMLEGVERQWQDKGQHEDDTIATINWYVMNNAFSAYQTVGILVAYFDISIR
jgi:hypothetical protein